MERRFCGKCGKPVEQCTCSGNTAEANATDFGTTHFENRKALVDNGNKGTSYYVKRFDNIALAEGEVVVRQYHIGKMPKKLFFQGKGGASIVITNKRVISKSDSDVMGLLNTTSVEEISLENVAGVKNYYAIGFSVLKAFFAVDLFILTLLMFSKAFSGHNDNAFLTFLGAVFFGVCTFLLARNCRKPSYLFSVYASTTNQALVQGSNMIGKMLNRYSTGIVFRYRPTTEAVKMMCEMGACIMDLKNKGDYAIDSWKQV